MKKCIKKLRDKFFGKTKKGEKKENLVIETLLPRYIGNNEPSYQAVKELGEVLDVSDKEGICNIALTGPYGCGKSSVLKTLQRDFQKKRKYLTISLATLHSDYDKEDKECDKKDVNSEETKGYDSLKVRNRKIEYSILQQLVYRERTSTVPHSRFKRIRHFSGVRLWGLTFWIMAFMGCICFVIKPIHQKIDEMCDIKCSNAWSILAGFYVALCVMFVIRYLIRTLSNLKVDKLNLKLGEIDVQGNTSIFNKHLDEILYFFRVTKYNVVLFEDLDRFESPDIYLKLRELNFLINQSKEINRHIVFVYAVKDDMFKNECRTKFFDYIIPVIPVINSSTSKDLLKIELEKRGFPKGEISDDHLSEIALFITDMRSLINIINEFWQYRQRLKGKRLYMYKLLAMIAYKNYCPDEFADLHNRKGRVYECLLWKDEFVKIALQSIQADMDALQKEKDERLALEHVQFGELRFMFLCMLSQYTEYSFSHIYLGGKDRKLQEIADNEALFDSLIEKTEIRVRYHLGNVRDMPVSIAAWFEEWGYAQRIERISEQGVQEYADRKQLLEQRRLKITGLTLSQLLKQYKSVRESDLYKSLKLRDMEDVFLKEGFIDEDYYDYISYSYPGMLSFSDRDYLLGIKMLKEPVYTYQIDEISNFIKELHPNNFEYDSILNVGLLDYLLVNKDKQSRLTDYASRYIALITQEPFRYDFLSVYYTQSKNPRKFFEPFLKVNQDLFWSGLMTITDDAQKAVLIECTLRFCGTFSDDMLKWIPDNFTFLQAYKENIGTNRLNELIKDVKFTKIGGENEDLLAIVVSNNAYTIKAENLAVVLNHLYHTNTWKPHLLRFDAILQCNSANTIAYLTEEGNLEKTVSCISIDFYNDESLEAIEFIVKSNLPEETKKNFLKGQLAQRPNVEGLTKEESCILYECCLVEPTWENVDVLYDMFKNEDDILVKFIRHNYQPLSRPGSASGMKNAVQMFDLLFGNNDVLELSEYEKLVEAFSCFCDGNDYLGALDAERFAVLLEKERIPFYKSNIQKINPTEHLLPFLIHHDRFFVTHLDWRYDLTPMIVLSLLLSERFTSEEKAKIVVKVGCSMIVEDTRLATHAATVIAENLSMIDLKQDDILSIMERSFDEHANLAIAIWLLEKSELNQALYVRVLKGLKEDMYCRLAEQEKMLEFDNNKLNGTLLDVLKNKGFIFSIERKENTLIPYFGKEA